MQRATAGLRARGGGLLCRAGRHRSLPDIRDRHCGRDARRPSFRKDHLPKHARAVRHGAPPLPAADIEGTAHPHMGARQDLSAEDLEGFVLQSFRFKPMFNKWQGELCHGFFIHLLNPRIYRPYRTTLILLKAIASRYGEEFQWASPPYEYVTDQRPIDLIIGDFLKLELPKELTKIVSNPPYSISSELMIKIIKELYKNKNFESSVMILQKDFVKRLFANPCSKNWGRISATFRYYTEGDIITTIPKKVFFPKPEVDSSLIKFWFKRDKSLLEFKLFEKITALLFQGPNKKIRRILKGILKKKTSEWESILRNLRKEVDLDKRVRCLSLSDIEKIGEKMIEYNLV